MVFLESKGARLKSTKICTSRHRDIQERYFRCQVPRCVCEPPDVFVIEDQPSSSTERLIYGGRSDIPPSAAQLVACKRARVHVTKRSTSLARSQLRFPPVPGYRAAAVHRRTREEAGGRRQQSALCNPRRRFGFAFWTDLSRRRNAAPSPMLVISGILIILLQLEHPLEKAHMLASTHTDSNLAGLPAASPLPPFPLLRRCSDWCEMDYSKEGSHDPPARPPRKKRMR